jgi:putative membrane protein
MPESPPPTAHSPSAGMNSAPARFRLRSAGLWPLAAGALLLASLWLSPLPGMARISFTAHMVLHLAVMLAAAPLLALGLARAGLGPPAGGPLIALALLASLFELLVVWGWHVPAMHEAAALRPTVFAAQQASFLLAGLGLWLASAGPSRRGAAAGIVAMLMTLMHMSMLGVLLAVAPQLYSPTVCGGLFGLDPLADQQAGGALMAVGAFGYLAGGAVLARRIVD